MLGLSDSRPRQQPRRYSAGDTVPCPAGSAKTRGYKSTRRGFSPRTPGPAECAEQAETTSMPYGAPSAACTINGFWFALCTRRPSACSARTTLRTPVSPPCPAGSAKTRGYENHPAPSVSPPCPAGSAKTRGYENHPAPSGLTAVSCRIRQKTGIREPPCALRFHRRVLQDPPTHGDGREPPAKRILQLARQFARAR